VDGCDNDFLKGSPRAFLYQSRGEKSCCGTSSATNLTASAGVAQTAGTAPTQVSPCLACRSLWLGQQDTICDGQVGHVMHAWVPADEGLKLCPRRSPVAPLSGIDFFWRWCSSGYLEPPQNVWPQRLQGVHVLASDASTWTGLRHWEPGNVERGRSSVACCLLLSCFPTHCTASVCVTPLPVLVTQ
jgi:hypothetical protein